MSAQGIEYGIFGEGSQILTNQKQEIIFLASDWLKFVTLPRKYRNLHYQILLKSDQRMLFPTYLGQRVLTLDYEYFRSCD